MSTTAIRMISSAVRLNKSVLQQLVYLPILLNDRNRAFGEQFLKLQFFSAFLTANLQ